MAPLPVEVSPPNAESSTTDLTTAASTTPRTRAPLHRTALDLLIAVLRNVDTGSNFPAEIRANVCSLLIQLGKSKPEGDAFAQLKEVAVPALNDLVVEAEAAPGRGVVLGAAAKKVLDTWRSLPEPV